MTHSCHTISSWFLGEYCLFQIVFLFVKRCQERARDCGFWQLSDVGMGKRTLQKPACVILFVDALWDSYGGSTKVMIFPQKAWCKAILCAYTLLFQVLYFL